jgi:hypothetical protein
MALKKSNAGGKRLILTLHEYNRIFGTIYSILDDRADTPHACLFFACAGALILNKYYKVPARAVGGTFMLCTDADPSVMVFGEVVDGAITSSGDGFHFWVQTEHHIIDFMAPIYDEGLKNRGATKDVPRKMFQQPISAESSSPNDLFSPGAFFTNPNLELTEELIDNFLSSLTTTDLLQACDRWFQKYPKKMREMSLRDDRGAVHKVPFEFPAITGAW